jgi:ATP-dependent Clp protease ATP-binding subunit ClpC
VILRIEPAMETGGDPAESRRWCARIAAMYSHWAGLRRMPIVPRELPGGPTLLISGFGAYRVLLREAGLHVLETEGARAVARVRVAPSWSAEEAAQVPATVIEEALATLPPAAAIVRRYRFEPSPLVRDAERGWRTGRLEDVLGGNFDLF